MGIPCVVCGTPFQAKRSSARYCSERCKKRAQRDPNRVVGGPANGTSGTVAPVARLAAVAPSPAAGGGVWRLTHDALVAAERLETVPGAIALALAMKLDDPGLDTGSSVSALARQLQLSLDRALDGANRQETPLEKRRRQHEARAS